MSNKYFSYSFQIHRTRKNIIIFLIFVIVLVVSFILFYKSMKHMETINKLNYEVVLGMNEFEDNNCKKIYRMSYKESTCGTICFNVSKSNPNYLEIEKNKLSSNGFKIKNIKTKKINNNSWNYFITSNSTPTVSYYSIDYDNKLYTIELIDQSSFLSKTKTEKCTKSFNKTINSLKLK